jgi:3-oxoadipate enol-lactonase
MPATAPAPTSVVLLHGLGGAASIWQGQLQRLAAAGFTGVALDLPGYGGREPVARLDFEGLAADVEGAIAARGLTCPVLVGHSLGGMIAQTLLRRRPVGYAAAILVCTSPAFGSPDGALQQRFIAQRLQPLDAGGTMADLAPGLVDALIGPEADAGGRAQAIAVMRAVPADTYRAALRCLVTFDERANLAHFRVPVLCLAGERDGVAPAPMMARMAAKIPNARFLLLPRSGHLPNLEAPEAFDAAMLDFLRDLAARPEQRMSRAAATKGSTWVG